MKNYSKKLALGMAAALLAVCAHAQTKITLGHTGVAEFMAAFVAQEEGFFKKRGLDVTIQNLPGGALVAGLQSDSLQIATLPPTNMLLANEGGLDMVAVAGTAVFAKTDTNVGLLAGANSGIVSPKDLVGKKVGVPSIGGFLYVMARKWMADKGVDVKQVGFVEVNFPQTGDLLKGGTIHAGVSADPFMRRAVQSGNATVLGYFAPDLPENTTGVFYATSRKWAAANPAAVKGFRDAIAEAVAFTQANPQGARADLAKYIKLPPEVMASMPTPRLVSEVTEPQLRYWIDAMREMGMIKANPATASLIAR